MTQRNFDSQIAAIQYLSQPNRDEVGHYTITEFQVEEWTTGHVCVTRRKQPMRDGQPMRLYYSECFVIGVRGARRQLYSTVY